MGTSTSRRCATPTSSVRIVVAFSLLAGDVCAWQSIIAGPKLSGATTAVASDAPLLPALDRAAGLARAPTHATGAAVLSASLAAYLAGQTSPPLALEREPGDVAAAFQLLGLWLAPFDADRTALASLSADACPGVVVR